MIANRSALEIVARAICVRRRGDPDIGYPGKPNWTFHVPDARAALQALLEAGLTEAMMRAAVECRHGPATYKAVPKPATNAYEDEARDDFAAMLRAALEETNNAV